MTRPDLTNSDLARMTRALADYYAREDTPDPCGWIAAEARMFEKRCGAEASPPAPADSERGRLARYCTALSDHYARQGALSWSVRLATEAERFGRMSEPPAADGPVNDT